MLNLDKKTYGVTPAALYLTLYLNEKGDRALNRAVGKKLTKWRQVIADVSMSHIHTDEMLPQTFAILLEVLDDAIRKDVQVIKDQHVAGLVTNILIGDIKTWKNRAQRAATWRREVARAAEPGCPPQEVKVSPFRGEETTESRVERLRLKSAAYLARKGKKNTLY